MAGPDRSLEEALGHRFSRPELLRQALIHPSTAASNEGVEHSSERQEFLGDRVLGLVIADLLFHRFPGENEGHLARRHSVLVSRPTLARVADRIGLSGHIVLSPGEDGAGGRKRPALLADICEAVIAALYLDGGLEPAADFIRRHWRPLMDEDAAPPIDAKTALQEWAQGRGLALPEYREVARDGPPHAPRFTIEAAVAGHAPAAGTGKSKRAAEGIAAAALLTRLEREA
ncbi:MAG: ribonuclease III [Rhodospirillales bacterium]|jgi:ribonuclease-3|nr:ribonuclease III [Rhodospirillales bacterium]